VSQMRALGLHPHLILRATLLRSFAALSMPREAPWVQDDSGGAAMMTRVDRSVLKTSF
jgi:hypothetical protein